MTKLAGEHYGRVFSELFGLETVALRMARHGVHRPVSPPDAANLPSERGAVQRHAGIESR